MNDQPANEQSETSVFPAGIFTQKRTAQKLIEESRADADFYLLLISSVFITTLGLIMNNPIVIVGAMLVAPILFPILALGLGVVTTSPKAIRRALIILGQTVAAGVGIALATTFLISTSGFTEQLDLLTDPDILLYFLISFAAGIVASFTWVSEKTAMTLPGVAITVSLVPPLAAIGVSLAFLSQDLLVGSLLLFLINLLGVVLASVLIFSLFGFSKIRTFQEKKITEEETGEAEKLAGTALAENEQEDGDGDPDDGQE